LGRGRRGVKTLIIKRREILPQLINPTQIFHELIRKQVVFRIRQNPVSIDSQLLTGFYFFKTSKMVTFGHRNAKGDLRTPQNRLFLFSVEDSDVVFFSRFE
jgi:hypothetical protein